MTRGRVAAAVIASILLVALLAYLKLRVGVGDVRRELSDVLTPGTPSIRVLASLDSLTTKYGAIHGHIHDSPTGEGMFRDPGKYLTAAIRGPRAYLANPLADGIFLTFKFDDQQRLVDHVIEYGYTGP